MLLNEMNVQLSTEHIERNIKGSPRDAIKELIWNACDADATFIDIKFETDGFEEVKNIQKVIIKDNGHGINYEKLTELFGAFGCSNKTYSTQSPDGRIYHGKLGQGRYQSFSIGNNIKWDSVYKDDDGDKYKFTIYFDAINRMKVTYTSKDKVGVDTDTGVTVEIDGITDESESRVNQLLNREVMENEILSTFAPYLLAYRNIQIRYDDIILDPEKNINEIKEKTLEYKPEGTANKHFGTAKIISWKQNYSKKIYICGSNGVVFEELRFDENKSIAATLYLMSEYYTSLHEQSLTSVGNLDAVYEAFYNQAIAFFEDYCNEKSMAIAQNEMIKIKDGKIYPYSGVAVDEIEEVERKVFDMLALEINRVVPDFKKANNPTKKLTYRLIKEAVKTNPDSLTRILTEVFELTPEEQDELAKLLDYTTLPSIINVSKVISDRMLFLDALEQMVYDNAIGKPIKERTQFHKVLLNELWVFGEKYALGTSDMSLKNVLKSYIKHLGRSELIPQIPQEAAVNLDIIPDICLWNQYPIQDEKYENLVIELKRPTKTLTKVEIDQIENYAFAIAADDRFPKENTKWSFILLGKDFDKYVTTRLQDKKNGDGNLYNSDDGQISISIYKWNKVIHDNKLRHQFLKDRLKYQIDENEKSLEYLRTKYASIFTEDELR